MPGNLAKLVIPTGYEDEQRKAAMRHKIAQTLMEKALGNQGPMQSYAQIGSVLANAIAGKVIEHKASKMDADVDQKIRDAYTSAIAGLNSDVKSGMSEADLVQKYAGNQFVQDALEPHQKAYAEGLASREGLVDTKGYGYQRRGDLIGKPDADPNAMMIPTGQPGQFQINRPRITAALAAQPNTDTTGQKSFLQLPPLGGGAPPAAAPPLPTAGGIDLSKLTPQERQILQNEIARRSGSVGQQAVAQLQNDTHTPMGSPLSAARAPAGVVNGKPYWLINGVPYDNPEGK